MHGVRFHADRRALIPRSFIGDLLAGGGLPIGDPSRVRRVLDLCTGSGCLAILAALVFPRATIDAVDLSAGALALARRNVATHRLGDRITLHRGDLFEPLRGQPLRPDPQQPALCRCRRHGEAAAGVPPRAAHGAGRRRRRARPGAPHPGRGAEASDARTAACCARSAAAAGRSKPPIPRLPFLWLDTEQSEGEVFWIARKDLA